MVSGNSAHEAVRTPETRVRKKRSDWSLTRNIVVLRKNFVILRRSWRGRIPFL